MGSNKISTSLKKVLGLWTSVPLIISLMMTQLLPSALLVSISKYFTIFVTLYIIFNIFILLAIVLSFKTEIIHERYRDKVTEISLFLLLLINVFSIDTLLKKTNNDEVSERIKDRDRIIAKLEKKNSILSSKIEFYINKNNSGSGNNIESFQKSLTNLDFSTAELMLLGNTNPILVQQALNNRLTDGSGKIGIEFVAENFNQATHQKILNLIFSRENMDPYFAFSDGDVKRSAMWYALYYGNLPMVRALIAAGSFSHPYQSLLGRVDSGGQYYKQIVYPINFLKERGMASTEEGKEIIRLLYNNGVFIDSEVNASSLNKYTIDSLKILNLNSKSTIISTCKSKIIKQCKIIDDKNKKYCEALEKLPSGFIISSLEEKRNGKIIHFDVDFYIDKIIGFSPDEMLVIGGWRRNPNNDHIRGDYLISIKIDGSSFFSYESNYNRRFEWSDTGFGGQSIPNANDWELYRNSITHFGYSPKLLPAKNCS